MKFPTEVLAVAQHLGSLREQVVFVGGMVRGLLVTDPAVDGPRPTMDVDVIMNVQDLAAFSEREAELRALGFRNDLTEDAPICRMVLPGASPRGENLPVDFMPLDPAVLGFSNVWYPDAFKASQRFDTDVGTIRVIDAPHFIATKLESFNGRGEGDYYHHDLEDIVVAVDGRPQLLDELRAAPVDTRRFVVEEFALLLADSAFVESLPGHLPPDAANQARLPLLLTRLRAIAELRIEPEAGGVKPARRPATQPPVVAPSGMRLRGHAEFDTASGMWRPARSSNIAAFSYDATTHVLTVEFRKGGRYEYYGVPATVFEGFKLAASSGRYHHRWIRDRYGYRRVRRPTS